MILDGNITWQVGLHLILDWAEPDPQTGLHCLESGLLTAQHSRGIDGVSFLPEATQSHLGRFKNRVYRPRRTRLAMGRRIA